MANLTAAHEWQPWPNQVADEKGLFADLAGDFRQPAPGDHQIRSPNTHKAGIAGSFSRFLRELGQTPERLAGDAVQIAPVSGQIPCKQGILQGKSRIWADRRKSQSRKPLCRRDFSVNSLSKLTGETFRRAGNSTRIVGNFRGKSEGFSRAYLAASPAKLAFRRAGRFLERSASRNRGDTRQQRIDTDLVGT
jgi:hypothetical protein